MNEISEAVVSDCGAYRYRLSRKWGPGPVMGLIMLNPSTADASVDDATIRRCRAFAKREGCGGVLVVNLFAFRATDPRRLLCAADPVGPECDAHIVRAAAETDGPLLAAWGAHKSALARSGTVLALVGRDVSCLGVTREGRPRHPLYVRGDSPITAFP